MRVNSAPTGAVALRVRPWTPRMVDDQAQAPQLTLVVEESPGAAALAAWDRIVLDTDNSDVTQLSVWAAVRRRAGYRPLYVLALLGDELVGGAALLWRRIPMVGTISYLPYGPLCAPGMDKRLCRLVGLRLTGRLAELASTHAAMFVQPPQGGAGVTSDLLRRGFRYSQAGIAPAATVRVDLTPTEDQLRAALSRRLRTWTRQWTQRGVTVRIGTEADIPLLARLAAGTALHQGFAPFPVEYLAAIHDELTPGGHVLLLIGELDGQPVAAELMTGCGGVLKSRVTGLDRACERAIKMNVASAMIWEAMRWGKEQGYGWFDFGGVRAESAEVLARDGVVDSESLAGPDRFKVKFGGEFLAYPPAVELIESRLLRAGYDVLRRGAGGQRLLGAVKRALRGEKGA